MKKRAQITIFLIIAIFFLIIIFVLLYFGKNIKKSEQLQTYNIENYVKNCIRQVGNEVIFRIGENGGYYLPSKLSIDSGVAYYYIDKKNVMPKKSEIENEISYFTQKKLFFCTKNFIVFSDFNISQDEIIVNTTIKRDEVVLDVNYPLTIRKGESVEFIDQFNDIIIPIRLGILYDSAKDIVDEETKNDAICLTCLLQTSLKNDFYVHMLDYNRDTVIYIFRDEKSKIEDKTFKLAFANKYQIIENETKI